ncbi:hypothetical protein PQX77_022248 [Marasmius sp. AFHP31]|nr:hypothetical protein PQX77_022248 [Marasmius sp. AFHP31]
MTIRCLPHAIHLAVREFLSKIKASNVDKILEEEVETAADFTEEMAEAVCTLDRALAESSDEAVMLEQDVDSIDLSSVTQKIRQISKIARLSPQCTEDFQKSIKIVNALELDNKNKLEVLNLILDVVTRWNSTYFMLKQGKYLHAAIDEICQRNDLYRRYRVSTVEWDVLDLVIEFLEVFWVASEQMSSASFPTLSISLLIYTKLIRHVEAFMKTTVAQENPIAQEGLQACKEKLEKYYNKSTAESEYYYAAADHRIKHNLFNQNPDMFTKQWRQRMDLDFKENLARYSPSSATPASPSTSTTTPPTPAILRSSSTTALSDLYLDTGLLGVKGTSAEPMLENAEAEYAQYLAHRVQLDEIGMDALTYY